MLLCLLHWCRRWRLLMNVWHWWLLLRWSQLEVLSELKQTVDLHVAVPDDHRTLGLGRWRLLYLRLLLLLGWRLLLLLNGRWHCHRVLLNHNVLGRHNIWRWHMRWCNGMMRMR